MFYEYNGEEFVYTSLLCQDTGQNLTSASMMTQHLQILIMMVIMILVVMLMEQ